MNTKGISNTVEAASKFKHTITGIASCIAAVGIIGTGIASAGGSIVKEHIVNIMDERGYAKQEAVTNLNSKVLKNGQVASETRDTTIRLENETQNLKELIIRQEQLIQQLLIELRDD